MSDSQIFAWLGRASICGVPDIERAAEVMKDYYQGIGSEPEYSGRATLPSPSTAEDERAAFERQERGSNLRRVGVERNGSGGWYENPCVQSAWEGWQARAALSANAADREAKERDAARYRWLRDSCPDFEAMTSPWLYDDLDKVIDAAMKATQKENQ